MTLLVQSPTLETATPSGLTIRIPPLSQVKEWNKRKGRSHVSHALLSNAQHTHHVNFKKLSSSKPAGSPNVDQSHDHPSCCVAMISKDELPLFKRLPWLTDAIITPFKKAEEYGAKVSLPMHGIRSCWHLSLGNCRPYSGQGRHSFHRRTQQCILWDNSVFWRQCFRNCGELQGRPSRQVVCKQLVTIIPPVGRYQLCS